MGFVARAWKDPVGSKLIAGFIGFILLWIAHHFFGATLDEVYERAFDPIQLPHWLVWLWILVTAVLAVVAGSLVQSRRSSSSESVGTSQVALDPTIEILTGPNTPYHATDVHSGQVNSTVKIGIKNGGGGILSNCKKVYIEKISPEPHHCSLMGQAFSFDTMTQRSLLRWPHIGATTTSSDSARR